MLIIEDDRNICQILKDYFEFENFSVILAHDGKSGLNKVADESIDLIILDIMLPEQDGWEICKKLRPQNNIPIIILSAKTKETDRITGLELGADDYVTKPFSPKEVVARAKAILRRANQQNCSVQEELKLGELIINKDCRSVAVEGEEIELTPKEFDLLWLLASASQQVFSRQELLNQVWGYDYFGDVRTVDTHIKSLRQKLGGEIKDYIQTVWGVGYKFELE
ncbi:MAG: response regulator transcription factor [Bacillota bacterium]